MLVPAEGFQYAGGLIGARGPDEHLNGEHLVLGESGKLLGPGRDHINDHSDPAFRLSGYLCQLAPNPIELRAARRQNVQAVLGRVTEPALL